MTLAPQSIRLSVVIASASWRTGPLHVPRRAQLEIAVKRILEAQAAFGTDPLGTEIIIMDATAAGDLDDHFQHAFPDEVRSGQVSVFRPEDRKNLRHLKNAGTEKARGAFLSFCEPTDHWTPQRLIRLRDHLNGVDLVMGSKNPPTPNADAFVGLLFGRWMVPSSLVISRTLFEDLGGFAETSEKKKIFKWRVLPGTEDYELALRALLLLQETQRGDRWTAMYPAEIESDWEASAESEEQMAQIAKLESVLSSTRDWLSLINLIPKLPSPYLPLLAKRISGQTDPASMEEPTRLEKLLLRSAEVASEGLEQIERLPLLKRSMGKIWDRLPGGSRK